MNKRETWETIKKEDPETARIVLEMAEKFGKLDDVEIIDPRETKEKENDRESDTSGHERIVQNDGRQYTSYHVRF
jgi:hypothetical protein